MDKLRIGDIIVVFSGGANGADKLGERWAKEYKEDKHMTYEEVKLFLPDWDKHRKESRYIKKRRYG